MGRKQILTQVGLKPDLIKIPNISEHQLPKEKPLNYVRRIAKEKALQINVSENDFLITADTTVVVGTEILHKTKKEIDARAQLLKLSGRRHKVYTAFCIKYRDKLVCKHTRTQLKFNFLTEKEIDDYLLSREWFNCAGSYSIQGEAMKFVSFISGCYSSVVGLPISMVWKQLRGIGYISFDKKY